MPDQNQAANQDELFDGGIANAGTVFRRGDTVIRPAGLHSPAVHALLRHLHEAGFNQAPQAISLDEEHETVTFIEGEVPAPPYSDWVRADATLEKIARLHRRYHDAVRNFRPPPDSHWNRRLSDPLGMGIIAHNDLGPGNLVFEDQAPVGVIDFDFAAPGRTLWDIARAIRAWAPLDDPANARAYGLGDLDSIGRLRLYCDAYELSKEERLQLVELLEPCNSVTIAFVRSQVSAGKPAYVDMWNDYKLDAVYQRRSEWLRENRSKLRSALE